MLQIRKFLRYFLVHVHIMIIREIFFSGLSIYLFFSIHYCVFPATENKDIAAYFTIFTHTVIIEGSSGYSSRLGGYMYSSL